jgi:hypothetical protein
MTTEKQNTDKGEQSPGTGLLMNEGKIGLCGGIDPGRNNLGDPPSHKSLGPSRQPEEYVLGRVLL